MADIEIVNLEQRARTAISLGESHFREFKSALHGPAEGKTARDPKEICKDISEALVAFANADGGELLIGVEDNGAITGINCIPDAKIELLEQSPKTRVHSDTPLPSVRMASLTLDNHRVLYFSVYKSTSHVHLTSDGRCVQRRDLETVPIPPEKILLDRKEKSSREYDRAYVDGATAFHLDAELVKTVADQLSPGMSTEKCLQYLELAEYISPGLRLRRAALLLFAREPNRWHPRLQLRIIRVDGTELKTGAQYNAKSDQTVTGNILELIKKGWDSLRPQLVQTRLGTDARFGSTVMYPELACREALVNAIAHRDYSEEGRGIEVYVFDDRMEVRNPGSLLSSIKIDDLLRLEGLHQSRNSIIARVLRELGYMRELGEGMRRMFDLMRDNELTSPELKSDANSFCITLRHQTIYNDEQTLWLDQFEAFNLSREQKSIVVLGLGGKLVATQDIWDSLGIVDTEKYRQLIQSLQIPGVLTSEFPKVKAQNIARKRGVSVRKIPRFKISVPKKAGASPEMSSPDDVRADPTIDSPDPNAQLWLANLSYSISESILVEFLAPYGQVENVYLPIDRITKRTKGYAFAEFSSSEIADQIILKINGLELQGRRLVVQKAIPKQSRQHIPKN